jgi:hypothetical protein
MLTSDVGLQTTFESPKGSEIYSQEEKAFPLKA